VCVSVCCVYVYICMYMYVCIYIHIRILNWCLTFCRGYFLWDKCEVFTLTMCSVRLLTLYPIIVPSVRHLSLQSKFDIRVYLLNHIKFLFGNHLKFLKLFTNRTHTVFQQQIKAQIKSRSVTLPGKVFTLPWDRKRFLARWYSDTFNLSNII
jgi:hypothetical protein